jgi:WD40 repeat protein
MATSCPQERWPASGSERLRHGGRIYALQFSHDGKLLVSTQRGAIQVWDAATGKRLRSFPGVSSAWPIHIAFGAAGRSLLAPDRQSLLRCDLATGTVSTQRLPADYRFAAMSPLGNLVGLVSEEKAIVVRDLESSKDVLRVPAPAHDQPDERLPCRLTFSHDGKLVLASQVVAGALHMRAWDIASGQELRRLVRPMTESNWIHLSRDGKQIAVVAQSRLLLLDAVTGKDLHALPTGAEGNRWVDFSASADLIAVSHSGYCDVFETATGNRRHRLPDIER